MPSSAILRSVTDPHRVSSNAVAVASSVTGLYATGPLEAVELSRTVIRAFGRNPETEKGAEAAAYAVSRSTPTRPTPLSYLPSAWSRGK